MPDWPSPDRAPVVFTIGHSTRSAEAFVGLLRAHGVQQVADIRTVPRSRRYPHFGRDALPGLLAAAGLAYRHMPALGGLRRPDADSPNGAWRNAGFRGYADYMGTSAFARAIDDLIEYARAAPTAIMCAEAVWWRCHRRLVADALAVRGIGVRHILSDRRAAAHEISPAARVDGTRVTYPAPGADTRRAGA